MPDGGAPAALRLSGRIGHVLHDDARTGFCILIVYAGRSRTRVLGEIAGARAGLTLDITGAWEAHDTYGDQFRAIHAQVAGANDPQVLVDYLAPLGVGDLTAAHARALIDQFGERCLTRVAAGVDLTKTGIDGPLATRLFNAVTRNTRTEETARELRQLGLSRRQTAKILEIFGDRAAEIARDDPWELARRVSGFGHVSANKLANRLSIPDDAPARLRGGLWETLERARGRGHCGLTRAGLFDDAARVTNAARGALVDALTEALQGGELIADTARGMDCIFQDTLHANETAIAAAIVDRADIALMSADVAETTLKAVEDTSGTVLTAAQRVAILGMLQNTSAVMTGGPGVGKSTSTRLLADALAKHVDGQIKLVAPTGRAAKRLSETTGRPATTIHRLLGARVSEDTDEIAPLKDLKALIVDEASMVDVPLMARLVAALPEDCALHLIGDADQLPSVGPGRVLADLIDSGALPVYRLTEILRQETRNSRIVAVAHAVNGGNDGLDAPAEADSDLFLIPAAGEAATADTVIDLVARRLPGHLGQPARDVQVLAPMKKGLAGVTALNQALRERLNARPKDAVKIAGDMIGVGDKVIQTSNDYELGVVNGDIGHVRRIERDKDGRYTGLVVAFDEGREVSYDPGQERDLLLAYALTTHKAQGSEFSAVVIPLVPGHRHMLERNLLYTAITRGKTLVVLVGDRDLVAHAARTAPSSRRLTRLREILAAPRPHASQTTDTEAAA